MGGKVGARAEGWGWRGAGGGGALAHPRLCRDHDVAAHRLAPYELLEAPRPERCGHSGRAKHAHRLRRLPARPRVAQQQPRHL